MVELKNDFEQRLSKIGPGRRDGGFSLAAVEIKRLFGALETVLENNLNDFSVVNQTVESKSGENELTSTILKADRFIKGRSNPDKVGLVFNFKPTQYSEARFKINYEDHEDEENVREYSLRIDQDKRLGGVVIDFDTLELNDLLHGIKDGKGSGHHFKSKALSEFATSEKFSQLVWVLKEIFLQTPPDQHFSVEDLKNKFNSKQKN